ncbi:SGNH/GDSL hydrolase family protein [Candidatus Woesearchaeota archaeon]|nr:SGNH/GDSL hydrolase family protein [Candidatus Woesearchaeota archaeon]
MPKTEFKRILQNILLLLVTLLIIFFLLEILLRIFFPQSLSIATFSSEHGVASKPNVNIMFYNKQLTREFKHRIRTNSDGLREDIDYELDKGDNFRMLAVGDSFVFGYGVELNETFIKLLEIKLKEEKEKVQVINLGVPGTGPSHYYKRLKYKGLKYNPDLVILGLFVGSDLNTVIETTEFTPKMPNQLPYFIASKSHAFQFMYLLTKVNVLNKIKRDKKPVPTMCTSDEKYEQAISSLEPAVQDFNKLAQENNFDILFVIIPSREQVDDKLWQEALSYFCVLKKSDRYQVQRDIKTVLEKTNSTYIDLTQKFVDLNKNNTFYYKIDGHFNKKGHELAFSLVYNKLKNEDLLN